MLSSHTKCIALDKALFSIKKYLYFFSYLSMKTYVVGSLEAPRRSAFNEYLQHRFLLRTKGIIYLIPTLF